MPDRLTSMAVFVRAADLGSFAAAAAALGMSAQMVAKHVQFLEDRLGTRLLNRTTRRQSLTEFGRAYYQRCRLILAEIEAAEALAQQARAAPRGRLRVNAPVTFGSHSLVPLITRYLRDHPQVQVDLTLSDRLVDPVEEGFEAVLRLGPIGDSSLVARPLAPYRLIACAAPAYLAEHGVPQTPADLARHECLGFAYWTGALRCQWRFSRDGHSHDVGVSGRLQVNDWKGLLRAALEGFGITLGPEAVLTEELATGRLLRVLPDYTGPSRPMHILYAADRRMTPKLRSFIERVVAEFGDPASGVA
ncbi:LysR family transcriptional regulator [Rhodovastum atsumiense]|uniref:LysR family transcriptional regulator n=1 Tax=Rhodovastum atsumiense TaxID=504468 RepID=A0A5M6IQZ2_9PROT|nr:LysR family transcriptional regulator [Rhodovastum atsumiense]KAA5610706.1 LysR family transcriptional regulator [Rhodovastum atsumiense]CAH2603292.1 LysR family transcriptional regulator [Rhodovastum atsumiense]